MKKNIKYRGTKIAKSWQHLNTLIIFVFLSVFQRKRKSTSILLSTSSVNKNIRCFRAARNCEEIGFQIPFVLDCLKTFSRAAFWRQLPCSVGRSWVGVSGWDRTLVEVASDCAQVSAMPGSQGGQGEVSVQWKGSMKLFLPIEASSSATDILAGQNQSWQAERWKRTGSFPAGHLEVMAVVWCPCTQGRHAEGRESVLEVFVRW